MDNTLYGRVRALFASVLVLSLATLGFAAVAGGDPAVWVRGAIVTVITVVLIVLARRALRGSRRAYLRMWLMSSIAPIAIVAIIVWPNAGFPAWMKIEQAAVGILLAAAAVMLGRKTVRRAYSRFDKLAE